MRGLTFASVSSAKKFGTQSAALKKIERRWDVCVFRVILFNIFYLFAVDFFENRMKSTSISLDACLWNLYVAGILYRSSVNRKTTLTQYPADTTNFFW